jgi:hypothetical protein
MLVKIGLVMERFNDVTQGRWPLRRIDCAPFIIRLVVEGDLAQRQRRDALRDHVDDLGLTLHHTLDQ